MKKVKVLSLIAITLLFLQIFSPNLGLMAEANSENNKTVTEMQKKGTDEPENESNHPDETSPTPENESDSDSDSSAEAENNQEEADIEDQANKQISEGTEDEVGSDDESSQENIDNENNERQQLEDDEFLSASNLVCNESAGANYSSDENALVMPTTMVGTSNNNHTKTHMMWAAGNIVYAAVKSTHNLGDMTLNQKANIGCDKFPATASITIDGISYDPEDNIFPRGQQQFAHWTVFKFDLASLGLSETGLYPFYVEGIGGGHSIGGNLSVSIPTIDVEGKKAWDGGDERPEITLQLFKHVGNDQKSLVDSQVLDGSENPEWSHNWSNHPEYDPYGRKYVYTVDEEVVPDNYKKTLDGLTVTNKYDPTPIPEPTKINITVTKVWEGSEEQTAAFTLFADGENTGKKLILNTDNWSGSFEDVDKFREGTDEEIVYTVVEDEIEGYITTVSGSASEGFTFTNTFQAPDVEKINLDVKKVWQGTELDSVTIKLFVNGDSTGKTILLNAGNNWSGSFNDLAKYGGSENELQYSVEEIDVPEEYDVSYSIGKNGVHIIKNTEVNEGTVVANYVDEEGRAEIAISETYMGNIGESYIAEQKEIEGYEFLRTEGAEPTGTFREGEQTVIFVYKKIPEESGSLTIKKVNENNKKLQGATFELRDSNNDVIDTKTTGENGRIVFEPLEIGTYTLVETKAPAGYRLPLKSISIEINEDDLNIVKTIENKKQGWSIPKTGGIGTVGFYGVGFILMAVSGWLVFRKREE